MIGPPLNRLLLLLSENIVVLNIVLKYCVPVKIVFIIVFQAKMRFLEGNFESEESIIMTAHEVSAAMWMCEHLAFGIWHLALVRGPLALAGCHVYLEKVIPISEIVLKKKHIAI